MASATKHVDLITGLRWRASARANPSTCPDRRRAEALAARAEEIRPRPAEREYRGGCYDRPIEGGAARLRMLAREAALVEEGVSFTAST